MESVFLAQPWLCNMASLNKNAPLLLPNISYWFPSFSCSNHNSDHNVCVFQCGSNCYKTRSPTVIWTGLNHWWVTQWIHFSDPVISPEYLLSGITILLLNGELSKYGVNKYIDRRWKRVLTFKCRQTCWAINSQDQAKPLTHWRCWFLPRHCRRWINSLRHVSMPVVSNMFVPAKIRYLKYMKYDADS